VNPPRVSPERPRISPEKLEEILKDGLLTEVGRNVLLDLRDSRAEVERLTARCERARERLRWWFNEFHEYDDTGKDGDSWQSDEFCEQIETTRRVLAELEGE